MDITLNTCAHWHRRPQAWAREGICSLPPPWKCCEVFCALVVIAKRSVDELFMQYFHNLLSSSGGFAQYLTGATEAHRPPPR